MPHVSTQESAAFFPIDRDEAAEDFYLRLFNRFETNASTCTIHPKPGGGPM
jgi:hypothetical protein